LKYQGIDARMMMRTILMAVCSAFAFLFALAPPAGAAAEPQVFSTSAGPVKITPLNHASTPIEAGGKAIYLDPAKPVKFSGLPKADLILITDIHGDHMDPDAIKEASKAETEIFAPPAVVATVTTGKPIANGEGKSWQGWTIEAIPAYNLKRGPAPGKLFHDKGRGNGYVLTYGGKRFYFSGDTEGVPEMRALKNIDVAFVCMNLPYTMPPDEAADAVKAFHPKIVIPYHYRGSDLSVFQKGLEGTGIEVRLLEWYPK
jgi:L-ascorbate metabolism protein UlaG (beta-lactamase superfamily)